MIGPPGAGQTMIAKKNPAVNPLLTLKEPLDITKIFLVAGKIGHYPAFMTKW
jgi:magnesium chelatase family protein